MRNYLRVERLMAECQCWRYCACFRHHSIRITRTRKSDRRTKKFTEYRWGNLTDTSWI